MSDTPQQDRFTKWFDEQRVKHGSGFDIKVTGDPARKDVPSSEQVFAELNAFILAEELGLLRPVSRFDLDGSEETHTISGNELK